MKLTEFADLKNLIKEDSQLGAPSNFQSTSPFKYNRMHPVATGKAKGLRSKNPLKLKTMNMLPSKIKEMVLVDDRFFLNEEDYDKLVFSKYRTNTLGSRHFHKHLSNNRLLDLHHHLSSRKDHPDKVQAIKNIEAEIKKRGYDDSYKESLKEMVALGSINLGPQPTASVPPAGTNDENEEEFEKKVKSKEFIPTKIPAKVVRKESTMKENPDFAVRVSSTSARDLVKAYYEITRKGQTSASLWISSDVKVAGDGTFFFDLRSDRYDQFFGAKELQYLLPPNTTIKDIPASEAQVKNDAHEPPTDKSPSDNTAKGAEMSSDQSLTINSLVVERMIEEQGLEVS